MTVPPNSLRVLIVFNVGAEVYGMERGVIEAFDLLRSELEPHFLMSYTTQRLKLPILKEIKDRNLNHSFFSDTTDWPTIRKPRSLREVRQMAQAVVRGNRDVLKAAKGKDFIYLPGISYSYFAILALIKHRLLGRRVIYQFHELTLKPSRRLKLLTWLVTDFVHCSRLGFKPTSEAQPFVLKRRNHLLPYRTGSPRRTAQRHAINGAFDGNVNLFFFGQVSPHKGVDILFSAFEKLSSEFPKAVLHVAGGFSDNKFERECRDFIKQVHLKDRIKYWGFVEDVEPLLKRAHIHVHPSPPSRFMDTFPLAALESMRLGVPTVCFRSGGLPEMIAHGKTGIVCEEESAESLAAGVRQLLDNPDLRTSYGKQAAARYQDLYSEEPVKKAWMQLFATPEDEINL